MAELPRESRASTVLSAAAAGQEDKPVRCAKFRQQELWAWKPVWSPRVVSIMYLIVAVIFIPLGIVILTQSRNMLSTKRLRYDNNGDCDIGPGPFADNSTNGECTIPIQVDKTVEGKSYFYYGLVNFYQNARTYVKSRSFAQLRGEDVTLGSVRDTCDPLEEDPDNSGQPLFPCGLVANSVFNDTFQLCRDRDCNDVVEWNGTGIAWDVDRERRFKANENNDAEVNERTVESEDFMVWMRTAAYRNWKKLYRIIPEPLEQGTYYVRITSQFPVSSFDGEKFFFISETTWFGGPNEIMGAAYIAVGSIALLLAVLFLIRSSMTQPLHLPPVTSVLLDGISPDPKLADAAGGSADRQGV